MEVVWFYKMLSGFSFVNGTSSRAGAHNSVSCTDLICHCHRALLEPAAKAVVLKQPDWLKYILRLFHLKHYSKLFSSQIILFNVGKLPCKPTVLKAQPCIFLLYLQSLSRTLPDVKDCEAQIFALSCSEVEEKKRMRGI